MSTASTLSRWIGWWSDTKSTSSETRASGGTLGSPPHWLWTWIIASGSPTSRCRRAENRANPTAGAAAAIAQGMLRRRQAM